MLIEYRSSLEKYFYQIEMSVLEILNIGSAAAGITSVLFIFAKCEKATLD